eukprot:1191335-Prorocentrum_minimum.AAC.8
MSHRRRPAGHPTVDQRHRQRRLHCGGHPEGVPVSTRTYPMTHPPAAALTAPLAAAFPTPVVNRSGAGGVAGARARARCFPPARRRCRARRTVGGDRRGLEGPRRFRGGVSLGILGGVGAGADRL